MITFKIDSCINLENIYNYLEILNNVYPVGFIGSFANNLHRYKNMNTLLCINVFYRENIIGYLIVYRFNDKNMFEIQILNKYSGMKYGTHLLNIAKFHFDELNGTILTGNYYTIAGKYNNPDDFYIKNGFLISHTIFTIGNFKFRNILYKK